MTLTKPISSTIRIPCPYCGHLQYRRTDVPFFKCNDCGVKFPEQWKIHAPRKVRK